MVIDSTQLDRVFGALSDTTRRGILAQLADGARNVRQLTAPYNMSQPAISKHLRVLEGAGLIERWKIGRETHVRAKPETAKEAAAWIAHYSQFWEQHFDAVEQILQQRRSQNED